MKLNKKGANALFFGVVAASSLLLVACGGGGDGGSSSLTYTGVATQAVIDSTSAPALTDMVLSTASIDGKSLTRFVAVKATESVSPVERLKGLIDTTKRLAAAAQDSDSLAGTQVSDGGTIRGCTGLATVSASIDDTLKDADGLNIIYSMSITFSNYTDDYSGDGSYCSSEILNGGMSVTVSYDGTYASTPAMNGINFTLSNFSVTEGGLNQAFNGSFGITWDNVTFESSSTLNADFKDTDGLVYRAQDYAVNFDISNRVTGISRRLYNPLYGYAEITTTTPFGYDGNCTVGPDFVQVPSSGVMRLDGSNGGYIELDAAGAGCDTFTMTWSANGSNPVATTEYW